MTTKVIDQTDKETEGVPLLRRVPLMAKAEDVGKKYKQLFIAYSTADKLVNHSRPVDPVDIAEAGKVYKTDVQVHTCLDNRYS